MLFLYVCVLLRLVYLQGEAELAPFDPTNRQPKMIHKGGYQPRYFVMDSFEVSVGLVGRVREDEPQL